MTEEQLEFLESLVQRFEQAVYTLASSAETMHRAADQMSTASHRNEGAASTMYSAAGRMGG